MAKTVYNVEEIELQDGTNVTLRPLNIKNMRIFMKELEKIKDIENEDEYMDFLIDLAVLCLKKQRPDFADREVAEDALDLETVFKVIEVMGGTKLNDPKMIEAAAEAVAKAQDGTN